MTENKASELLKLFLEYRTYKLGYSLDYRHGSYTVIDEDFISSFKRVCEFVIKSKSKTDEALTAKTYSSTILECLGEMSKPYATGYSD